MGDYISDRWRNDPYRCHHGGQRPERVSDHAHVQYSYVIGIRTASLAWLSGAAHAAVVRARVVRHRTHSRNPGRISLSLVAHAAGGIHRPGVVRDFLSQHAIRSRRYACSRKTFQKSEYARGRRHRIEGLSRLHGAGVSLSEPDYMLHRIVELVTNIRRS